MRMPRIMSHVVDPPIEAKRMTRSPKMKLIHCFHIDLYEIITIIRPFFKYSKSFFGRGIVSKPLAIWYTEHHDIVL